MAKKNGDMSAEISLGVDVNKSSVNASYRKIQEIFNDKPSILFNVDVRKSSINKAFATLRDEFANKKAVTVNVVPKMDVSKADFAGKNSVDRIKNYIQSLLKDVEVKLTPKFDMRSITASIRNMKQELNKVAGTETDTKVNTLIIANHRGNIDSPEMLSSWIEQISRFNKVAQKIPHGLINVKVNLVANIDENFKQLLNGGLDLSKVKSGKLDINIHDGEVSSSGGGRHKGGKGKSSGNESLDLDDLPTLNSGNDTKLKRAIDEMYKHISNKTSKTLEDAVEKATGVSFKNTGANRDVHLQSAMAKLATQAQKLQLEGKTDDARALEDVITRISNELAKLKSDYAENGLFGSPSKSKLDRLQLMTTSDYHKQLDSDANARIEAGNRRRKQYQDSLKSDLKKSQDVLATGNLSSASKLLGKDIRNSSDADYTEELKKLKENVDNFHKYDADEQQRIKSAIKQYAEKRNEQIKNLLDNMKVRSEDFNKSIAQSYMKSLNSANDYAGVNSLDHGEKLENFAWMRDNMAGNYDSAAEHRRKAIEQRKQRLDPLQKEIDDLIVARNKGEKSTLGTNPELLNLINTKLRLMSEIGGADFGLEQQIDYIKSLKKKNIDSDAHGMLEKLLNQMVREFEEGYKGTVEGRIKYYNKQISDAFNKIKSKAGHGEDVTSDINRYMGFRSKLLEAQTEKSGGANADYSGASKGMASLANIKGIDSGLLDDIKKAEDEFRRLANAQNAAGDTTKKLENEFKTLKDSIKNITDSSGVNKLATDLEKVLNTKFSRGDSINKEIGALSQMAVSLNNRGLDGEPIAKLARKFQELSQQAKQVTQAEQQVTRAQSSQNQKIVEAEAELQRLIVKLDNAYKAESALGKLNPFSRKSSDIRQATQAVEKQLEALYKLKREMGQLRTDADASKELMGRSTAFGGNLMRSTRNGLRNVFENLSGRYAREEAGSRDRVRRTDVLNNLARSVTYVVKFLGRSAKGSGSALEASAMGFGDAFSMLRSSTSVFTKFLGGAGIALTAFIAVMAGVIEVASKLASVFKQLFYVVSRLLEPGVELYKQVTKSTYSMGAAISSNSKFNGNQIPLDVGIATSSNLQKRAILDAEKSVFDFGEIVQSLSGTLPILLGRGMTLEQAYQTNLGVASVAKLTNLAPNQVLQETRDLAQGTITARSSQVANALGITSADLEGKDANAIFDFFMEKFDNYKEVLKQYAETPVGAFEQMMDRFKTVSMKFVEELAYPFKRFFNYLTDLTGTWVDSQERTLMRVEMGDGTTEQFWRKFDDNGNEVKDDEAITTIKEATGRLEGNLYKLFDAIERISKGTSTSEDRETLNTVGANIDDYLDKNLSREDIVASIFGNVENPVGDTDFKFSAIFEDLKAQFVDIFEYLGGALDELISYINDVFGSDVGAVFGNLSDVVKFLIDVFVACAKVIIDVADCILVFIDNNSTLFTVLLIVCKLVLNACKSLLRFESIFSNCIGAFVNLTLTGFSKILSWIAKKFHLDGIVDWFDDTSNSRWQAFLNNGKGIKDAFLGLSRDGKDTLEALGFDFGKSFTKIMDNIKKGKADAEKKQARDKQDSGKALSPNSVIGNKKPESDKDKAKREREARKSEKKAFDKYIAQLRDALERHIQELKDALDKNEAAYKQGLKNYDAYIQEKMKNELEEQVAKRDELLKEIEAIKNTGKYESEDEREKDLYTADKKLQSINKAIDKLTITQGEVTSILGESNQLLETLVGLNRSSNDKKDKADSDITTKVETKEESLNTEDLLKYRDINDLDDKKSWAMQYFRESGFASDNASSMLAHTLTNSADLSGNIFGFDLETLNAYATKAGLNLSDATDMFKTNIMIATDRIKEAIPTDNAYTLDQFNAELKKLGMFIGDADLSVMNQLAQSFKPFMRQITTTTHTLANANGVVNQAINGYKEGEEWLNPMRSDIHGGIQCDSWVGDVYYEGGLRNIGNSPISKGTVIQDWMFQQAGLWHDVNSGYVPKPGDYISGRTHVGIVLPDGKVRSRDSWSSGVRTYNSIDDWDRYHHIEGYGEVGPLLGGSSGTNAIKDVVEKIIRGTASTYTGNGLQAIEMKEKYLTTEFNLQAQLDKYEQNTFDSMEALAKSAEAIKKTVESKFDIIKTTGINDKQQDRLVKGKEKLMIYQVQEVIAKQISEQAEAQLENIESSFSYNLSASASRLDFDAISSDYKSIFDSVGSGIGSTIKIIKDAIDEADASGNKLVSKNLRQTLYKFTSKLNEFFDKAEEAITKQYEYVESALNNIGATNLQKEGISRRFNIEKNRAFAELYRQKEGYYTEEYKDVVNQALKEVDKYGNASNETLKALADVQDRLVKNHWALQQAEELGKFKTALEEANDTFKQAFEDGLIEFMTEGVNSVLEGTKTIGEAFRELALSILKTMQQFFAKRMIENFMNRLYPNTEDEKKIIDTANWQPRDLFVNKENQTIYNQQMSDQRLESVMREGYVIKNPVKDVVNAYDHGWRPEYEAVNPVDTLTQKLTQAAGAVEQFKNSLTGEWQLEDENGKTLYPTSEEQQQASTSVTNFAGALDTGASQISGAITNIQSTVTTAFSDVSAKASQVSMQFSNLSSKIGSLGFGSGFATGGYISGPGTSTSDSIPAMLSDGEFVVKASAVKKYGTNFLDAVNSGTFATIKPRHHYASGGLVTETAREATSTVVTELGKGIGTNINNEAHFNLVMASNQEDAMRAFMRSPEGQRIYLDMARKYASTTVRF